MPNLGSETELVEFKRTTAEQKLATDSMVAMLNRSGAGTLFFGVKDNGDVLGQERSLTRPCER